MRALVVCESMFGNTRTIAERIADGLGETMEVDVVDVGARPPCDLPDYALVVVGGPTHAFSMSTPESRMQAGKRGGAAPTIEMGIREWLPTLVAQYDGSVAVFDTRMGPRVAPGAASRAMRRRLTRMGLRPVSQRSFLVAGQQGPLKDGEMHGARVWGHELALRVG